MDPAAPAAAPVAAPAPVEEYEHVLRALNQERMVGFERLITDDVHRRFGDPPGAHGGRVGRSLHHAVIDAVRLRWDVKPALLADLVQRGLDLNVVDGYGHTPLYDFLAQRSRYVINDADDDDYDRATVWSVQQMVELGARIVALPEHHDGPSIEALAYNLGPRSLRALFEMGADPFAPDIFNCEWAEGLRRNGPVTHEYRARQAVDAWAAAAHPRLSPSAALSDVAVTGQGASLRVLKMLIGDALDEQI